MDYEFNLEEWLPRFPPKVIHDHYHGCPITSPCELCNIEWLRRGMTDEFDWGTPIPMDIFVMSKGEPPDRHATKIGGLPYRPAAAQWPQTSTHAPMTFLAQFDFSKSRDLVGHLPGGLLLIFFDPENAIGGEFHFEWRTLDIANLIKAEDMPRPSAPFTPCYGNRCRMMSFPDARRKRDAGYPRCNGREVCSSYWVTQFQAMQIGRAPFFISEWPPDIAEMCYARFRRCSRINMRRIPG